MQRVAVKVLRVTESNDVLENCKRRLQREIRVWAALKHDNVTPFLGISCDFDRPGLPCLVSPFYAHGNIITYLENNPDVEKLFLISKIALALSYLHNRFIFHGDIKGRNILVNDKLEPCLTDFGLSRILRASGFTTQTPAGTVRYMAHELIALLDDIPRVTAATDVWSFSMTIVEIFTGSAPFSHIKSDFSIPLAVADGVRPRPCPQINPNIFSMLTRCWDVEPMNRPPMAEISSFLARQ